MSDRRRFILWQPYQGGLKNIKNDGGIKIGWTHPGNRYFIDPDHSIKITKKNLPFTLASLVFLCGSLSTAGIFIANAIKNQLP